MARKAKEYVVGIIISTNENEANTIKFVTRIGERHVAYWEDDKEAITFSESWAVDMCKGFAWNGIVAVPILKQDYITHYKNPKGNDNK